MIRAAQLESVSHKGLRRRTTLALCTVLHAFTHAYGTMLVPLYLLIRDDLNRPYVSQISLLVTLYTLVYCLGSFPAGILADRLSRKRLLTFGLLGHAGVVLAMGLTHSYPLLVVFSILAGAFATFFHPAANSLVTSHFPESPGMAIGLLGMGAGIGFFAGPQYAGWRAQSPAWELPMFSNWQRPCIELGLAGLVIGILFLLLSKEASDRRTKKDDAAHAPLTSHIRWRVAAVALVLGCRDFAGVASVSLLSIYLLSAHHLDVKRTGFIVGAMMLLSVVVNPFMVYFSGGKRRLPVLAVALVAGGLVLCTVPHWPVAYVLPVMCLFQVFQLGSYAVSDAAILERVPAAVRGRVVGLFLTLAGTFASLSPWIIGAWVDALGGRAEHASAFWPLFVTNGALLIVAAFSTPLIARLGEPDESAISPVSEIQPQTMEPVI